VSKKVLAKYTNALVPEDDGNSSSAYVSMKPQKSSFEFMSTNVRGSGERSTPIHSVAYNQADSQNIRGLPYRWLYAGTRDAPSFL